jgi:hypothetical protein
MEERVALANRLKTYFHARQFTFEDKGARQFSVNCWRRGVFAINDRPDDLKGIVPMRDGVQDKHVIRRCHDARESWESRFFHGTGNTLFGEDEHKRLDQSAMLAQLKKESPAFRTWLLKNFQNVPAYWRDSRYGVKAVQDGELLRELADYSPEAYFLSCLDEVLFKPSEQKYDGWVYSNLDHGDVWTQDNTRVEWPYILATSKEIESKLQRSEFSRRVEHQLRSTHKILEQLREFYPERVQGPEGVPMRNGANRWRINNPFREEKQNEEPTS